MHMSVTFDGDFPCTGCSLCCRNVSTAHASSFSYPKDSILYRAAAALPYSWDESGSCNMLKDGMCSVYSSRPLLCNVKELSKEIAKELNSDVKAMYAFNAISCNSLISAYGLDPQFMIDVSQFQ